MSSPPAPRGQLASLIRQYQRDTDAFDQAVAERLGVNRTDLRCLDLLLDLAMTGHDMTPARLGDASGLTPSTVTSVLDRLEKAGYIRRARDQENRRQVLLQLTEEFVVITRELFGPVASEGTRQLEEFSDEEVATLIKFFSQSHDRRVKRTQKVRDEVAGNAPDRAGSHKQRAVSRSKEEAWAR
jgi:DNA-binding MarR family transcriptional regulator